jgi:hypothetical protein
MLIDFGKKKEGLNINKVPSIYYKGYYQDYDWRLQISRVNPKI